MQERRPFFLIFTGTCIIPTLNNNHGLSFRFFPFFFNLREQLQCTAKMLHYFYLVISSFFDIYWSVYHTNSNQQPWGYVSLLLSFIYFYFLQLQCKFTAIMLHYFYLVTFGWMLCEGLHIYSMVIKVFNVSSKIYHYTVLAWGMYARPIFSFSGQKIKIV